MYMPSDSSCSTSDLSLLIVATIAVYLLHYVGTHGLIT